MAGRNLAHLPQGLQLLLVDISNVYTTDCTHMAFCNESWARHVVAGCARVSEVLVSHHIIFSV